MRKKILAILLSVILGTSGLIYPIHSYAVLPTIIEGSVLAEALASYIGLAISGLILHQKVNEVFGTNTSGGGGSHSFNLVDNGDGTVSLDQNTCDSINSFYQNNFFSESEYFNSEIYYAANPVQFGWSRFQNDAYLSSRYSLSFGGNSAPVYVFYYLENSDKKTVYFVSDENFYVDNGSRAYASLIKINDKYRYYYMASYSSSYLNYPLLSGQTLYYSSSNITPFTSNVNLLPANSSSVISNMTVGDWSTTRPVIYFYLYGILGQQTSNYYLTDFNPVTVNVKFDKDVIYNTDWETVNNNNYNKVINNINNSSDSLTVDQIKKIVKDANKTTYNALLKLQTTLKDASEDIDAILSEIRLFHGEATESFTTIINLLQDDNDLVNTIDYTSTLKSINTNLDLIVKNTSNLPSSGSGSSGDIPDQIDYRPRLDQIIDTLEDLLDRPDDLNILIDQDDNNNNFFDLMKLRFSDSGDLMSKRFPTSIPWDIAHAFKMFKADPVAPEFHIPIKSEKLGITETIDIDLSENSTVSNMTPIAKTSRTLLTGLFIMFLIALTRKLFGGDK